MTSSYENNVINILNNYYEEIIRLNYTYLSFKCFLKLSMLFLYAIYLSKLISTSIVILRILQYLSCKGTYKVIL